MLCPIRLGSLCAADKRARDAGEIAYGMGYALLDIADLHYNWL
jgi:hypothetical protein